MHVQIHEGCRRFPTIVEFTARILIQPSSDSLTLTFPLKVDINEQKGNFDSSYTHVRPYVATEDSRLRTAAMTDCNRNKSRLYTTLSFESLSYSSGVAMGALEGPGTLQNFGAWSQSSSRRSFTL